MSADLRSNELEAFTRLTATALPIDIVNLDTDQLIPSRFLMKPRDEKYWTYLFHDLRYDRDGAEIPDFLLNRPPYRGSKIIVGSRNFGCGSSREGAVFALTANGFRAIIAPSFGDIFFNNCFNNGVLPVVVNQAVARALRRQLIEQPGTEITIDLEAQQFTAPDGSVSEFAIDPHRKYRLLKGLDAVTYTLQYEDAMTAFERQYRRDADWLF